MVFVFRLKGFPPLSGKNAIWLAICAFTYACLLTQLALLLTAFADCMAAVVSLRDRQTAKYNYMPKLASMKYILMWKRKMKNLSRLERNCPVSNCYFTENRALFSDYTYFEAIVFDQSFLSKTWSPIPRSPKQLYIFSSEDSPSHYPACRNKNDDFFNWTFTYRLDSDVVWKFFVVRDLTGNIIAPNLIVQWNKTKLPIASDIKTILQGKTRAAAWIVKNCNTLKSQDQHLIKLRNNLSEFSLQFDIYGVCTKKACDENGCEEMIRKNYYFYIAFENSLDDDYVTKEVLYGYNNYAVPIVYGGANYSRFLPPGSYIDARQFHPSNLAKLLQLIIKKPQMYENFFSWTNFYTFDFNYTNNSPACDLCVAMNSGKALNAPAKKNFRSWWNKPNVLESCLPDELWNASSRNLLLK